MGEEIAVQRRTERLTLAPPAYGAANDRVVENQRIFGDRAAGRRIEIIDLGDTRRRFGFAHADDDAALCGLRHFSPPILLPNSPIFGEFSVSYGLLHWIANPISY